LSGQPTFLLASLGRTLYALNEEGEVKWRVKMAGPVYAVAPLEVDRVAVGDDAGFVTLLDARGQQIWQFDLGSRVTVLQAGWMGGLLAGGWDERLSRLSQEGQLLWSVDIGAPVSGIAVIRGLALVANLEGQVRAYDTAGAKAWSFDAGAPITDLGVVGTGDGVALLAGVQDGRLLALGADGTLQWQVGPGTVATGAPVWSASGRSHGGSLGIVVGTGGVEPSLTLVSGKGEVSWRLTLPSQVGAITTLDLDGDGNLEIVAGLSSGEVQVFDGQGRLRGAVHAGLAVWDLEATQSGSVLILADVVAYQLAVDGGQTGAPWLPPPAMLSTPADLPSLGVARGEGEAILTFLGDVALGRSMEAQLARYGSAYPWQGLRPLLLEADLAVANLEGVLATAGQPLDKSYLLRAHPLWSQSLVEAGLDLVTLANNHALDYGEEGLDETLVVLGAQDIEVVGAGRSQDEARRPAEFTLNGVRVALLGYAAARWNGSVDVPATERVAWAYPEAVQADVVAMRDRADLVVVILHAGTEYASLPSSDQVTVAHAAVDAGADLVVGHHPHVTQTIERYKQGLIIYSLGDALFDIPRPAAMRGHLLRVHVSQEGVQQAELWPFWIEDAIRPRLLVDGQETPRFRIIYP
jgi:poly-gamma-glutamate synthesis protein (capsule biosynthesis protein)